MPALVETMAYNGDVPWHGLGKRLFNDDISVDEMLDAAGLNWKVEKKPIFAKATNGHFFKIPKRKALIRDSDSRVLSMVSDDWNPVQNAEIAEFFREFCEAGGLQMHTAGSLKNGEVVWMLARLGKGFRLFKEDVTETYLLFTNFHQYGKAYDVRYTFTRAVCWNTVEGALLGNSSAFFRADHRSKFDAQAAKDVLGIADRGTLKYAEFCEFIASKSYTEETMRKYIAQVFAVEPANDDGEFRITKPAQKVLDVVETQPGAQFGAGTFYQLFQAVTYGVDHIIGTSFDTRAMSATYGAGRARKHKAMDLAIEYAKAA